jgi:hypothetical protein
METTFDYLRAHAAELGSRILETYPPLQSTKDPLASGVATLLRKALPAQGLAITGTAKFLRNAKAARIVAECGAGKTFMALGTIHVLADGHPSTTLVMPFTHHAQMGTRGSADDPSRPRLPHRRHAQRRRSEEATRNLRSEVEQRQDRL